MTYGTLKPTDELQDPSHIVFSSNQTVYIAAKNEMSYRPLYIYSATFTFAFVYLSKQNI